MFVMKHVDRNETRVFKCSTYSKSRKVAGSIPDGVTGIFHRHNPSGRIMVLGSTQPPTKISTGNTACGVGRSMRRADSLTAFMYRLA